MVRRNRRTDRSRKRPILEESHRMGSESGTILSEAKYQRDGNTTSYSMNGTKANARIRVEQDANLVLKNPKLKILDDDVLLRTDRRLKQYKANEDRIILIDELLFQKYKIETGSVKYITYQSS